MTKFKKGLLALIAAVSFLAAGAQLPNNFNIDALSDQQLMQFMQSSGLMGLSEAELLAKAKERGLSEDQIAKLRSRAQSMTSMQGSNNPASNTEKSVDRKAFPTVAPRSQPDKINGLTIFGSELFTKENLSFEPNINIPTPRNYVIGFGDELKIDIYGYSDKAQTLKVNPEGNIRYPNIGPIRVAGLTIEEAKARITQSISKIYPGLKSGNTSLQLSLGQIRSIRVNLIGEIRQPGTYTLSSLATIANALYASGGPTLIGSYRNIELIRDGKTISRFDLYDYLLKGDLRANKVLQDDDVIRVAPYTTRVEINGAVKRPAIYELAAAERLSQALQYAGGLADSANKEFVRVLRFGKQEKEVFTVPVQQLEQFVMLTGDKLLVDTIANVYKNRVRINGAVYFPGAYSTDNIPTLKDLLALAKPKEEAYRERAVVYRLKEDFTPEMQYVNLHEVLSGKANINLRREDSVQIFSLKEIREPYTVEIRGEVNAPSRFNYAAGMQVQDLVLIANGYRDGATNKVIEVARRIKDSTAASESPVYATVLTVDLSKPGAAQDINTQLKPFDIVTVRKSPVYKEQVQVQVEGEVLYPGPYVISSSKERLSDLMRRAGGLKQGAYAEGAFLLRKTFENLSNNDTVLLKNKIATLKATFSDTVKAKQADSTLRDDLKIVGIRLQEALDRPGSVYDVVLQEGDILKVPKEVQTVQTFSGVYFPKKIVYRSGLTVKQVIRESGGVLPEGQKRKAYVVYPNGEVKSTRKFLFFTTYPTVKPGSEVYVPVKKEGRKLSTAEILGITTGLATLATMVITISNLTK
ncbi:MAG: SLBB domain-containing protein [Chitinophagaceae bacterium]